MSQYRMEIQGLKELTRDSGHAAGAAKQLSKVAMVNIGTKLQSNIRGLAPHKTGALQRSIMMNAKADVVEVRSDIKYGVMVEEGTRAHTIEPKSAEALYWKGADHPVKRVRHPGTKGKKFFAKGIEKTTTYAVEQMEKVAERLVNMAAGH